MTHTITASWTTVAIRCAGCGESWEQGYTDPDNAGWNVCPRCLHAAPTKPKECPDAKRKMKGA